MPNNPAQPTLLRRLIRTTRRLYRRLPGRSIEQKEAIRQFRHIVDLAAEAETAAARSAALSPVEPFISFVVPVFNAKRRHLDELLASFVNQPGPLCELILSDDGSKSAETRRWLATHSGDARIKIVRLEQNGGIAAATNLGLAHASGEWIGLVDHDDALAPFAVSRLAVTLAAAPSCRFLYTDEAITDAALRPTGLFLKPAWDPVLLSGLNYINHLSLYRRDRLLAIGGLREDFQGSQDYDLLIRYTSNLSDDEILHLPYPAYLWRRSTSTFSAVNLDKSTESARRALSEHYRRDGHPVVVDRALSPDLHRLRFDLARTSWPLISVVIPTRDAFPLIARLLEGLTSRTDYPAIEIIVVDNGSRDERVLDLYEKYRKKRPHFVACAEKAPFNFSRAVNLGAGMAKGERILFLNNDIEILDSAWLKEMESCFDYPDVGVVGAKLLYPNRTIQHAGVIVGFGVAPGVGTLAGHWYVGREHDFPGPMGRLRVRQSFSSVTGACLMVSRECLERTGPFDEIIFPIAYNDVDFCLRAAALGFRTVWTPFATLVHHESATRGSDETDENIERFRRDQCKLRDRHRTDVFEDRAFSPWYSRDRSEPIPVRLSELPRAR